MERKQEDNWSNEAKINDFRERFTKNEAEKNRLRYHLSLQIIFFSTVSVENEISRLTQQNTNRPQSSKKRTRTQGSAP